MSKPMSEQMQKVAERYERATGKKFNQKTNADHIRSMSDEELAVLFGAMCAVAECHSPDGHVCPFIEDCPIDALGDKLWPNWLKQPYKEDA